MRFFLFPSLFLIVALGGCAAPPEPVGSGSQDGRATEPPLVLNLTGEADALVTTIRVAEPTNVSFKLEGQWWSEEINGRTDFSVFVLVHESMVNADIWNASYTSVDGLASSRREDRPFVFASNIPHQFQGAVVQDQQVKGNLLNVFGARPFSYWSGFYFPGESEGERVLQPGTWHLVVGSTSRWMLNLTITPGLEAEPVRRVEGWQSFRLGSGEFETGANVQVSPAGQGGAAVVEGAEARAATTGRGLLFAAVDVQGSGEFSLQGPRGEQPLTQKSTTATRSPQAGVTSGYHRADVLTATAPGEWVLRLGGQAGFKAEAFLFFLDLGGGP